jgi:hypothetical protein
VKQIIERAAAEKAVRDIDNAVAEVLKRRGTAEEPRSPFPLPDTLTLHGGPRPDLLRVYEDFGRPSRSVQQATASMSRTACY